MCFGTTLRSQLTERAADSPAPSCFTCSRLNSSTFRIVEDDIYGEAPFIYVKTNLSAIIVIDTGCGPRPATEPSASILSLSLRQFIETYPVMENQDTPLNPNGIKPYTVICTHCHFDHIGGIAHFSDSRTRIWASAYDAGFLSPERLGESSLCDDMGIETPKYTISDWAKDGESVDVDNAALTIYHIPGHTPDQLAVWDAQERHLFVGDMLYLDAPILFLRGGSAVDYAQSLTKLRLLVKGWDSEAAQKAKISCGHITSGHSASTVLADVEEFFENIRQGKVPATSEGDRYGMRDLQLYEMEKSRISFLGPRKVFDELLSSD